MARSKDDDEKAAAAIERMKNNSYFIIDPYSHEVTDRLLMQADGATATLDTLVIGGLETLPQYLSEIPDITDEYGRAMTPDEITMWLIDYHRNEGQSYSC